MSRTARLLIFAVLLTSCKGVTVYEPVPVSSELLVYVPVPTELTEPQPVAKGPLRDCPSVAKARAAALEQCNADKASIARIQGTSAAEGLREPAIDPDKDGQ